MNTFRHTLGASARKLTLVRATHILAWVAATWAGAWMLLVLVLGVSMPALVVLSSLALATLVVALPAARVSLLEGARHVERLAGWKEKLSTAVELDEGGRDNVFYERLSKEVAAAVAERSPARMIAWRLERPGLTAAVLLAAAGVVTAVLPGGLPGALAWCTEAGRRTRAEEILSASAADLRELSARSAGANVLRLEVAGLLEELRRGANRGEIDRKSGGILRKTGGNPLESTDAERRKLAAELANSAELKVLETPVSELNRERMNRAEEEVAAKLEGMPDEARADAERTLRRSGDSALPGTADALNRAADAVRDRNANALRDALAALADELDRVRTEAEAESRAAAAARDAVMRARSVLAGTGDPGERPRTARAEFFGETPPDTGEGAGRGNVVVRGKVPDITEIWKEARAADAEVSDLADLLDAARVSTSSVTLDAKQREYVRRYFARDSD